MIIQKLKESFLQGAEMLVPVPEEKDKIEFPNKNYLRPCHACGRECFWGRLPSGKWLLFNNPENPHLHECPINPYIGKEV